MSECTWIIVLLALVSLIEDAIVLQYGTGTREYCNMEAFNASCKADEVIVMDTAQYGRMKLGRCVRRNLGYLGCQIDAMPYMDKACTGKRGCQFTVPTPALYSTKPCPGDTTPYLEAGYTCTKVAYTDRRSCASQRQVILNNTVGYISSTITRDYGIGSTQCPWKIQVKAGQRIRLSVFNLARSNEALPNYEDLSNERRQDVCYEFAMLKEEGGHMRSLTSCNGEERINIVYTTESNAVTIEFVNPNILDTLDTFLMKYEALGCAEVNPPEGATVKIEDGTAHITCNNTGHTFSLVCEGSKWKGKISNCTKGISNWDFGGFLGADGAGFPYGILLVVSIGVALGVFFGGILLTAVVLYMKRKQRNSMPPPDPADEAIKEHMQGVKYHPGGAHIDPELLQATWDRQAKYNFPDVHTYPGALTDRDSGYPGSTTYRPPTEDSAYFERDMTSPGLRQHIYESPQFT